MNGPGALQQNITDPIKGSELISKDVGVLGDRFTQRDSSPDDLPNVHTIYLTRCR